MKKEDFQLKAVKLKANGAGVSVTYNKHGVSGGVAVSTDVTEVCNRVPHPDLVKSIQSLTVYLAMPLHLTALTDLGIVREDDPQAIQKAIKQLMPTIESRQREILDRIDVRALSLSGSEGNQGAIISGVLSYKSYATNINSPRLRLSGDALGNEIALTETIDEIIDEVYSYLFKGKQAQLDAFQD